MRSTQQKHLCSQVKIFNWGSRIVPSTSEQFWNKNRKQSKSVECLIKVVHILLNIGGQFLYILTVLQEIIYPYEAINLSNSPRFQKEPFHGQQHHFYLSHLQEHPFLSYASQKTEN